MNIRQSKRTTSIAVTWFVSYMVVLLVPLCVFIVFSVRYMAVLTTEIEYFNALSIRQVQLYVDNVVQESYSVAETLNASEEIKKLLQYSSREKIPVLDLYAAQERIRKTRSYVQGIEDIYLFCPSFDLAVGKTSYTSSQTYFASYLSDSTFSFDQWRSLVSDKQPSVRLSDFSWKTPADSTGKILLVRPLTVIPHGKAYANLVMVLDRSILQPASSKQFHTLLITDTYRHRIIYNSSSGLIDTAQLPDRCFKSGLFTLRQKIGKNDFMIAGTDSGVLNWKYLALEERSEYFGQSSFIQRTTIIWLSVCFFLGLSFIALLTRHSYKSVDDVVKTIDTHANGKRRGNEFLYIHNAIEKMQEDKKYQIRNQMITDLVQKFDDKKLPSRSELAGQGITFQSNLFAVMVYRIGSSEDSENYRDRIRTVITRAFSAASILVYFFDVEEYIGAILNIGVEKESDELYERMEICMETMCRLENRRVPVACSNIVFTYFDLYTAFVQAIDTLNYARLIADAGIHFYRDMISHAAGHTFEYSAETEVRIMDELKKGNETAVMGCIDEVIALNRAAMITPKSTRFLLLNIAGTVIKVFSRLDEKALALYPDISLRPILEDTTFEIFRDDIKKIVHGVCEVLRHDIALIQNREEFSLYNAVLVYINEQYTNFNLSLNLIADEVDLSPVALSRLFKKYSGDCISDYIISVRIAHAKQLLKTGAGLASVASQCGFASLRTFMRVFKNQESMTPGQYETMAGGK
jgi:two-component system, response regulator YesN